VAHIGQVEAALQMGPDAAPDDNDRLRTAFAPLALRPKALQRE
jgi:hypothetical protein